MKTKADFSSEALRQTIIQLANLKGFESPVKILDELLAMVKSFNDYEFTCTFYLNIHYLCNETAGNFWSDLHKKEISTWLSKAPFHPTKLEKKIDPETGISDFVDIPLFATTWETRQQQFESFEELFNYASYMRTIERGENLAQSVVLFTHYEFQFNLWLQRVKGWEYGTDRKAFFNKDIWMEFIEFGKTTEGKRQAEIRAESLTWSMESKKPSRNAEGLTISQIGLIHAYNNSQITRKNGSEIAARYNFTARTSGEKLFQLYTKWSSSANRIGLSNNDTKRTYSNKIKSIEYVFTHLTDQGRSRATDEIKTMKIKLLSIGNQ